MAVRIRLLPPLPRASSARARRASRTMVGDIIDATRTPGRRGVEAVGVQVVLAQHVVEQDPGARDDVAGALAVRRRHRRPRCPRRRPR